jgi:hypothetical protein
MKRPTRIASVQVWLAGFVVCAAAAAQPRDSRIPPHFGPLARWAPQSSRLFLQFERLDLVHEQWRNVNAWRLIELALEKRAAAEGPEPAPYWADVLAANLGLSPEAAFDRLFAQQVALAAPDWEHLADGVVLFRLTDREVLRDLVGPGKVRPGPRRVGRAKLYQTKAGLWVATDDRVVALSQRGPASADFRKTVDLLAGKSLDSLADLNRYRDQMRLLPGGMQGFLYFDLGLGSREPAGDDPTSGWAPTIHRGVVGIYVSRQQVNFAIRATRDTPRQEPPRPRVDLERLNRLPQTTLLAWATSVDAPGAYRALIDAEPPGAAGLFASLLERVLDLQQLEETLVSNLGPRTIVVWGQTLREPSALPQLALLFESRDARAAALALEGAAQAFLATRAPPAGDSTNAAVQHLDHLGTTITRVPFAPLVSNAPDGSVVSQLGLHVQPCFAALDGWLVLALTPDHLREIIDADRGLIPTLGEAPELGRAGRQRARAVVLGLAQPALAAQVIQGWLTGLRSPDESPWAGLLLGETGSDRPRRRTLGIGMRVQQVPGRVRVARVYPGTPAEGHLLPGDEILGVESHLLSLAEPNEDLRSRIAAVGHQDPVTLRVWREEELLDVVVPLGRPAGPESPSAGVVEALEQLTRLGQELTYAAYSVSASRSDQYVAMLTLGFRPAPPESASAPAE